MIAIAVRLAKTKMFIVNRERMHKVLYGPLSDDALFSRMFDLFRI